jgi:hypothetical protein
MKQYLVWRRAVVEQAWMVMAESKREAGEQATHGELIHGREVSATCPRIEEVAAGDAR